MTHSLATKDAPFVNTLGMKFVPVPITGGPTDGKRVLFSIWETRVQDYEAFVKDSPREWAKPDFEQGPTFPAVNVTKPDADEFCAWLTARERKAGRLSGTEVYRLPTDHEWSCAAGIGAREDPAKTPNEKNSKIPDVYPWGTQWPPPAGTGNFAGEEFSGEQKKRARAVIAGYRDDHLGTSPVGTFPPNGLGLYDLAGNVREWCVENYSTREGVGTLRDSAWNDGEAPRFLASVRQAHESTQRNISNGFRVVLAPE
jgi:formylglycine-generating enzyme required for sulfatase activity